MVLKISAVTPGSESACPAEQATASEAIQHHSWDAPWILVGVPPREVELETSHWRQEQSNGTVYIVAKHDDVYEVIINPVYLLRFKYQYRHFELNLDFNPLNPKEKQKYVYGAKKASKDARTLWLCHAAHMTSSPLIRKNLALILVVLFLNLTTNYDSLPAYHYLASNEDDLLEKFQLSLPIPVPPERTKRDEAQITSLVRALLELSGGRVNVQQHGFAQEYTLRDNADLYASVLGITRERTFGDSDSEQIYKELLDSPVFSETAISAEDLEESTLKMRKFLPIGFRKDLNLPLRVSGALSVGQLDLFDAYLASTYDTFSSIRKPENNILLLITWSTMLSKSFIDASPQFAFLREWEHSEEGQERYRQLVKDVQDPQSVEQLALNMAALMIYLRVRPDPLHDTDRPITGSYLVDLDALFRGNSLATCGRAAEQMVFALVRVLRFRDRYEQLVVFLETVLDRESSFLHFLDGLADQYMRWRMLCRSHKAAFDTVVEEVSHLKVPRFSGDVDSDWVLIQGNASRQYNDFTLPAADIRVSTKHSQREYPLDINLVPIIKVSTAVAVQEDIAPSSMIAVSSPSDESYLSYPPGLRGEDYTLIRLTDVADRSMMETLDTAIGTINEVPSVEELSDGSLEICVLKSYGPTAQGKLGQIFPDSDIERDYNPLEPTARDAEFWGYCRAKKLHQQWLFERCMRIFSKGWPAAAAACYSNVLRAMCGLHEADAGFMDSCSSRQLQLEVAIHCSNNGLEWTARTQNDIHARQWLSESSSP